MSIRMKEKFNQRNELILQKAEKLIKANGYQNIKMIDIAEALDIAKGTLYLHFKSKERLVFSIVKPKIAQFLKFVEDISSCDNTAKYKVINIIQKGYKSDFFDFVLASFPDMGAVFSEDHNKELSSIQKKIIERFEHVIKEGMESKQFDSKAPSNFLALQLMQLFDPLVYNSQVTKGDMSHEDFVQISTGYFLNAIKCEGDKKL
ncbi:TetR/AcrR family transcriptional regulator [Gracilibacillus kekensis]|uniref:Transcriptional regulator, TetR family n=1 Tax=Gracilibacillus kekensis TaxID=1027249 RepID=A0A1M7QG30_9BACI|nr:TetR/AcrR family transcriptional regulator [Gracilibacillus kekensis]SHN29901.1 transcriptional regulator, TetR family [Gracilibacillus kekensis]